MWINYENISYYENKLLIKINLIIKKQLKKI